MAKQKLSLSIKLLALISYIVTMIINFLVGSTTVIGGQNTAQVSDKYANLFAPAGITFTIWGVIYLALAIFLLRIFGVYKSKKKQLNDVKLAEVTKLFIATSVLNVAWLFSWQYEIFLLSVVLMFGLLAVLIRIHAMLYGEKLSQSESIAITLPFSLYFGWITVASIANVTTWLASVNWNGYGLTEVSWMVIILIVGAGVALAQTARHPDWVYLAVIVWAYAGILTKHLSRTGWDSKYPVVIITVSILLSVLSTVTFLSAIGVIKKPSETQ